VNLLFVMKKTNYEKYLYLVTLVAIAFFTANWLIENNDSDKMILSVESSNVSQIVSPKTLPPTIAVSSGVVKEKNESNNSVNIENETIQNTINIKNESIKSGVETKPILPVRSDKYVDYGEYIQDIKTGLLWQKDGMESGKLNFYQAKEYAKKLKLGNLRGWRVPTIKELESIFPALDKPFINTPYTDQKCCKGPYEWHSYWTSEMDNSLPDYAFVYHWYQFGGANNCYASKNYDYVRCVHDPL
jgi:hypothetical protein